MTYRNFVRPAVAERRQNAAFWMAWMEEQGDILVPVAPHQPLSCLHCYGASRFRENGSTWPTCWECGHTYGEAVDTFVPITYSLDGGLESMLHQYKDGAARWLRQPLASLLTLFVHQHADCIDRNARGIDVATVVPANSQHRSFNHLDRLLRGAVVDDPIVKRFSWSLDAIARDRSTERPRRRELKPESYTVDSSAVSGAAVLLLDDTWTSGASSASAAAALKAAGAHHVTVLTLGRQLNPNSQFGSTEAIYADRHAAEWSLDACVLCT